MDVDRMLRNAYKPIRFCTLNKLNRDWRNVAKKTSTSLMSTQLIVFGALFASEILRVDSPVSNIIYVPHVQPPRLPWRKCCDIFVRQHMTWLTKKRPQCDPCLCQKVQFWSLSMTLTDRTWLGQILSAEFTCLTSLKHQLVSLFMWVNSTTHYS